MTNLIHNFTGGVNPNYKYDPSTEDERQNPDNPQGGEPAFGDMQNGVLEGASNSWISDVIRGAPIELLTFACLYWIFFRKSTPRQSVFGARSRASARV